MSEMNNDKDVIQDGRKQAFQDVDAPLRDQIVQKLYKKLEEMDVGIKVVSMWTRGEAERSLWSERQRAWLASWDEHLVADSSGDFDGSSQLHVPMPFIVCKTMHSRFLQAIWQDIPFNTKAQNEASVEAVPVVRDVMKYYLSKGANYNKGVGKIVDEFVWDWVTMGSAVMKLRWDTCYSRYLDVQTVMEPGAPQVQMVNGQQVLIPTQKPVEKEVVREVKTFDGPVFTIVDLEDLIIIGGKGDPDEADHVLQRIFYSASELWTLVDRKIFSKDAVEAIIQGGGDRDDSSIKLDRARNAGRSDNDTELDHDRYEFIEAYMKLDVDGSGINTDVICWVHKRTKKIARATYLYRVSPKGSRPFAKVDFQTRKGQEHGVGMVELLYPLSKEMDAMHNMRIDFGLISTMPFGFYRASSSIEPATIKYEPGSLIPVDNPQTDVYFPNLGNRTVFGFQEEQALQTMVERLTSISDLNLGIMSGNQGATRTATGSRALVGEMSSNLDVYLRRLNFGWEKALTYLLDILQQRIPTGLAFRLTGDSGSDVFRTINSAKDIQGQFDVEVSPNSSSSNQGIQLETAQQISQIVSNPLAIQLGIITPTQFYNAQENLMRALGVKDFGKFLNKPQGPAQIFTPEQVANRLLRGVDVPVTPNDDLEGYLSYFQHIHDNDELLGQFTEQQTITLAKHAQQVQQMLQALQQMQAQQANSMQMQRNAQQGAPNPGAAVGGQLPGQQ